MLVIFHSRFYFIIIRDISEGGGEKTFSHSLRILGTKLAGGGGVLVLLSGGSGASSSVYSLSLSVRPLCWCSYLKSREKSH